jgi:DNA replication protein DnaC
VGTCPLCGGTGWSAEGEGRWARRRRCEHLELLQRIERFNAAGIPARHAESTRVSFDPSGNRELTRVIGEVTRWTRDYRVDNAENRGLVLWGDVGRGKTHLLVAMLREIVLRTGATVQFVEFSHLLAELKAGFDAGRGASELLDPLVAVQVLAIDELGKGRNTDFEQTVIDELVSRRYNAMAPILATTNYPPGESTGRSIGNPAEADAKATLPALVDRIGQRVYSRLRETCDFVGVPGEDWRERRHRRR